MNNFWIVFFKTLNRTLNMLTLASVILVFCLDMWLFNIPAPCQFFVACGKFFYGVGLSFIAAYIFYLITVHYPEVNNARIVYKASDFPAMAIVTNIEWIFIDMAKKQGNDIKRENLNEAVIKDILSSTKCYDDSTLNDIDSQGKTKAKNWLGYIVSVEKTYRSFINGVKPLYSQLDSEYVAAISEIEQCDFSQPIMAMLPFLILPKKAQQESQQNIDSITFNSGLEDLFLKLYNKSQVLRKIIEERRLKYKLFPKGF